MKFRNGFKTISLLSALFMLFFLAACGDDGSSSKKTPESQSVSINESGISATDSSVSITLAANGTVDHYVLSYTDNDGTETGSKEIASGTEIFSQDSLSASTMYFITIAAYDSSDNLIDKNIFCVKTAASGESLTFSTISTAADLQAINTDAASLAGNYLITADIDLEDYITANGWTPIGDNDTFTGVLNGNGHTVSNLTVGDSSSRYQGLFGHIDEGALCSMGVIDVNVTGENYVGGLVGYNSDGTVSNCYATGEVIGDDYVGGLVGCNSYGTISNCYAAGDVTGSDNNTGGLVGSNTSSGKVSNSYAAVEVNGSSYTGGLVGNNSGTINNSYTAGEVTGTSFVGGLIGYNSGTASNSYAAGEVTGNTLVGGLIGYNSGTASNCFYDTDTTEMTDTGKGTPKSTSDMKTVATFTDVYDSTDSSGSEGLDAAWDFADNPNDDTANEDIWAIDSNINSGYPYIADLGSSE